ncbi:hypothetical protein TUZN_1086 [Thermoproteus uzoniensis 768-20]|uniref:Uncharacterized protein n=1 Tax=Thermoproteus uzoniensis (strain 768-20) TaxID=999630 RepID=F2L084_THEU7|nr:hypothetical protein [Thermoproteus uzoniensis]AEA12566.1 hypothetical protein TUZN_1086 [Thermoproteus uzoniensis 768-20]
MNFKAVSAAAIAALALAGALLALISNAGILDVSRLAQIKEPAYVTVSGKVAAVDIGSKYVVLRLVGDNGFAVTALINKTTLYALYGPVTPSSFESVVVVRGLYLPGNDTIVVSAVLRGCHSAYAQPAANT